MATRTAAATPKRLPWTGDDEADRLIATDPTALLIGFALDQQVTVQKAFSGPLVLRQRVGTLDPGALARMHPDALEAAFAQRPAIHRFPRAMAQRVQALCAALQEQYGGDSAAVWRDAVDGSDLDRRIRALPGFGPMKARTVIGLLTAQYGVRPPGWERVAPDHPNLGQVRTPAELEAYQSAKRAHKAKLRAEGGAVAAPVKVPRP